MEKTINTDGQHQNRISALDGLRGIASIVIVAFHVYGFGFFVLYNKLLFIQKYFAFGVTMFLIISAFSLALNYHDKIQSAASIMDYYINRYARITPLFIFMTIVWILINNLDFKTRVDLNEIVVNVFYLYNFIPDKFGGIIRASWPIGVLFIFYLLFPFIINFNKSIKSAIIMQCVFIIIGLSMYSFFKNQYYPPNYAYVSFFSQLPIFGFGILSYYFLKAFNIRTVGRMFISAVGLIGFFLVFYVLSRFFSYEDKIFYEKNNIAILYYYIMGFFMAFFIYSQCLYSTPVIDNAITRFYGKISYSLYLLHPLVIYKITPLYTYFQSIGGMSKELSYFICFLVTLIIVTPLAYLLHKIFEERASFIMKTSLKRVFQI
ncbi:MAG: hypothetical protein CVU51_01865 [Deltaproteobacteria bacterium HGW-Deltaproteobacteria-1]|jgi:peptidoglycan/LPS O-acetylase OafA/YrhL|nr:MAG: hypothetical protein CVU51_01865 [Deltaproteobacteria bacterium HGW-Deltaproteobacteria-1]